MNYGELKKLATELGIKSFGVPKVELEKLVAEKQGGKPVVEAKKEEVVAPIVAEQTPKKERENANTAIVYNGTREIRRYTVGTHGEGFIEKATEFAQSSGYTVKLLDITKRHKCPACGHAYDSE